MRPLSGTVPGGSGELARAWALLYPASAVTVLETPEVVRDVMDKFLPHERVCFMPGGPGLTRA